MLGIDQETIRNVEQIIASSEPNKKLVESLDLESSIFLNNFISNMSSKHLSESLEKGANLFSLLAMDYLLRFKGTVEESNRFIDQEKGKILDGFANYLKEKDPKNYRRSDPNSFALGGIETDMAATFYLNYLGEPRTNGLLKKSSNLNDLKAVLMINELVPNLVYEEINEIIDSDMNPEQAFIVLSKIRYEETKLDDLEKYQDQLKETIDSIGKVINSDWTEESGRVLISLRQRAESFEKTELNEFKEKKGYINSVGRIFSLKEDAVKLIDSIIKKLTVQQLEEFNPNYEKSDDPKKDLMELEKKKKIFEEIKTQYSWFGLTNDPELKYFEKRLENNQAYLLDVINNQEKMEVLSKTINEYLPRIEKTDNFTLDYTVIKELLEIRGGAKKFLERKKWLDDHYLSGLAQKTHKSSQVIHDKADSKLDQILEHAKYQFMSFLSKFKSSGDIEKDLEKAQERVETAKKIIGIYQLLGKKMTRAEIGLENIEFIYFKFEKTKKTIEEIEGIDIKIDKYKKEIERAESKKIESKTVDRINLCYDYLESTANKFQRFLKNNYLKEYNKTIELIEKNMKINGEINQTYQNCLEKRLNEILEKAEEVRKKVSFSKKDIISMKGIQYFVNYFKLEGMKGELKNYLEEIENIGKIKFFKGEKPRLEEYYKVIEKKKGLIQRIKSVIYGP